MKILHYDAFTKIPNMGNPAGIVLDGSKLHTSEMQEIARNVGFNETVFLLPSTEADIKLKYFTPGHEIDLCGHGTIATLVAAIDNKIIKNINSIETNAGILNVAIDQTDSDIQIKMEQKPAQFVDFIGDIHYLAESLDIDAREIDSTLPIVYGNTGIWTLLVPIKSIKTFTKMKPKNNIFPDILTQNKKASIHPFSLSTYNDVDMHGRHFSSPYSGTIEDPATGTASGVMGAYYSKYIKRNKNVNLKIEQGQEIGKDAIIEVNVRVNNDIHYVGIKGTATFVKEIKI